MITTARAVELDHTDAALVPALAEATAAGLDGIVVTLPPDADTADTTWPEGVLAMAWDAELAPTLTHAPESARAALGTLLQNAATLGVPTVEIAAGHVDGEVGYLDALQATYDGLLDILPEAERLGVRVAVSTHARAFLQSPVELRDLIERVNSPAAAVSLDWATVPGRPLDWLTILGPRVAIVRAAGGLHEAEAEARAILTDHGAAATWVTPR